MDEFVFLEKNLKNDLPAEVAAGWQQSGSSA